MTHATDATKIPLLERTFRRSLDSLLAAARAWPGHGLVAAVSGGADSVALLRLLAGPACADLGRPVTVAHLDHGLRGEEARQDLEFTARLAGDLGFDFVSDTADTAALAAAEGLSVEDAARRLRRTFLKKAAAERGAQAVLLAHTLDDQAETVLLNLLRGAGPRGLGAMPAAGPAPFLRPLLAMERGDLRTWLSAEGVAWREDSSNADTAFTRNRIRIALMPLLRDQFNPQVARALVRTAGLQREIDDLLRRLAARRLLEIGRVDEAAGRVTLDRTALLAEPPALQRALLRAAGERLVPERLSWGGVHVAAVLGGLIKGGEMRWVFPSGVVLVRSGDELRLERSQSGGESAEPPPPPEPVELPLAPGSEAAWGGGHLRVTLLDAAARSEALRRDSGPRTALFDAEALGTRLVLRAPGRGDRMSLFGRGDHRKLSDLLIDARIPAPDRRRTPVVTTPAADGALEEILWIPGLARSAAAPLTEATRRVALLEWFGALPQQGRKPFSSNALNESP